MRAGAGRSGGGDGLPLPATQTQLETIAKLARGAGRAVSTEGLTRAAASELITRLSEERYGARLDTRDPVQVRAQRKFLERNFPILLDRMRGVAAAYGKSIDDDSSDFTTLGFTDLKAGCSIAHLPPSSTTSGKSVVSRDYDFTTGDLSFGFLAPGMLHPTARPYLLELHPDQGYASIAMVAYDLLSGVLDGILTIDDVLEVLADNLREMVQAIGSEHRHEVRSRT